MQQRKRDVVTMVMRKKRINLEVEFKGPGVEVWGLDTAKVSRKIMERQADNKSALSGLMRVQGAYVIYRPRSCTVRNKAKLPEKGVVVDQSLGPCLAPKKEKRPHFLSDLIC